MGVLRVRHGRLFPHGHAEGHLDKHHLLCQPKPRGAQCGPARGRGQRGGKRGKPGPATWTLACTTSRNDLFVNFGGRGDFLGDWRAVHHGPGEGLVCQKIHSPAESGRTAAPLGGTRPAGTHPLRRGRGHGASHPSSQHCPFCRIAQGEAPCYRIYEDEYTLAFLDTAGDVEGHTLVIPKVHVETIDHCPEEIALNWRALVRAGL